MSKALQNPQWVATMQKEMDALEQNGTWELTPLPLVAKPVGIKWVFNVKFQVDGSVERYKDRLVAKGFTQIADKYYNATFVHLVIFLAVSNS